MATPCQPQETKKFESTHGENGYSFEETFKMVMPKNYELYNCNSTVCCGDSICEYRNCSKKGKNFIALVVDIQHVVEFTT